MSKKETPWYENKVENFKATQNCPNCSNEIPTGLHSLFKHREEKKCDILIDGEPFDFNTIPRSFPDETANSVLLQQDFK